MALPWITGLGIQAREVEAQGIAEGHHSPVPTLSIGKPQAHWVSWREPPSGLHVVKAYYLQAQG